MPLPTSLKTALAVLLLTAGGALASGYRESPLLVDDPAADNTDLYAWVQGTNLIIVANYIGLEQPEAGPNWQKFSDDVIYEIHLARGASIADALTWQFRFTSRAPTYVNPGMTPLPQIPATGGTEFFPQLSASGAFAQTYSVTQLTQGGSPSLVASNVVVPPPNVGPFTRQVIDQSMLTYDALWVDSGRAIGTLQGGGRVFAGPRDDPFFMDFGALYDLVQLRPIVNPGSLAVRRNSFAYTNVHSIVLELPLALVNGGTAPTIGTPSTAQTVGVWASASRRKVRMIRNDGREEHTGPLVQVSRVGWPLIDDIVIGVQDKDRYNHGRPANDLATFGASLLNPIIVRDAKAVGFYMAGGPLAACTTNGGTDLSANRVDLIDIMNLTNIPSAGAHAIPLAAFGDVLRVDLGLASGFPNGRLLTDDVVAIELGLLLCRNPGVFMPGPSSVAGPGSNETPFRSTFPFLAAPWDGRSAMPRAAPTP